MNTLAAASHKPDITDEECYLLATELLHLEWIKVVQKGHHDGMICLLCSALHDKKKAWALKLEKANLPENVKKASVSMPKVPKAP
jgi:hypothetical protein